MPEKPKGLTDPALHPEWVYDEGGNLVPWQSPASIKGKQIENARIAREKAAYEQGFAGGNSNSAREEARERARDGGRER